MIQASQAEKYLPYMRRFALALIAAFILNAVPLLSQETNTKETRYVVGVARNLPPYSFLDETGKATGYSVDITHAIAQVMKLAPKMKKDEIIVVCLSDVRCLN